MSTKPYLLTLLGALALASPSCESPDSPSTQNAREKPEAHHHSTATLEIHSTLPYQPDASKTPSKNFLRNQIAIISANEVIAEAAKEAGIDPETIKKTLWIEPIADTDLIKLSAYHDDQSMTKRIAESVIHAYIAHRNKLELQKANASLKALDEELILQGDLVQEHRKELTVLIQSYGLPYFDDLPQILIGATEEEIYHWAQKKLDDYEIQHDQLAISIQKVMNTPNEDIVRMAAGLELPENQVTHYYQSFREFSNQVQAKLDSGLVEDHPTIIDLQQKASRELEHAQAEVVTLKQILDTKLQMIKRQVEKMREIVDSKQNIAVELSLKQHNYNQAKDDYEQSRDMYREMKIKQQEARVLLKMPRTLVTIHGWDLK